MENDTNIFKVFELQPYNKICNLIFIITLRSSNSFQQTECFVLNTGDPNINDYTKIKIEPIILNMQPKNPNYGFFADPELYIENINEFLFDQSKNYIENRIRNEFDQVLKDIEHPHLQSYQINFVEKEKTHLFGLHMRGICSQQLKVICSQTRNKNLQKYISNVLDVGPFVIKEHK